MDSITTHLHHDTLAAHFKSLNEEWLKRLFVVEPIDQEVLSHPEKIIADGGQIIYAKVMDQVVGCVALKHHDKGVYELTKMAVTSDFQARGIGAVLMSKCLQEFVRLEGQKLYLETHSSLQPAIKLYARFGFVSLPHPFKSEYQRSDYYMEHTGELSVVQSR